MRRFPVPAKSGALQGAPPRPLPVGVGPFPPRSSRWRVHSFALAPTLGPPWSAVLPPHEVYLPPPRPRCSPSRAPRQGRRGRRAGPRRGPAPTAEEKKQKQTGVGVWGGGGGGVFEPSQGGGRACPRPGPARRGGWAPSRPPRPHSLSVLQTFSNCSVSSFMLPTKLSVPGNPFLLLSLITLLIHESVDAK